MFTAHGLLIVGNGPVKIG